MTMQLLSLLDQELLKVSRAINDLRLGIPVLVDQRYLILAAETISKNMFERLKEGGSELFLAVSAHKAFFAATEDAQHNKIVFVDVNRYSFEKFFSIVASDNLTNYTDLSNTSFEFSSVFAAMKMVKLAELIPTFLILNFNDGKFDADEVLNIASEDVEKYFIHINNDLSFVAEANLSLRDAAKARILSFRSQFIAQEHYAILVGDISKVEVPSVRIHSSCYTGDLIASLSCDCRDQLTEAIRYMGSDESRAGVVLYLMQEGRGIGLTNKIRTYKLQEQGYDTVEANHILGFEGDERVFDAAASMLKQLGIGNIKLLTNNPLKIQFLQNKGIKVSETISLFGEINKYNESYLVTKKDKMGHNL